MPNTGFTINAHRRDPYKNFKFVVKWGTPAKPVLGISKVSALKRTTEVIEHRSGGDDSHSKKMPGRTKYEAITMERGLTHDIEFEKWANQVHPYSGDSSMDLVNFKKDLMLEVKNEKGHTVFLYKLLRCWVSEFTSVPDLDANTNTVAIESIKIEIEGWERDIEVKEPNEKDPIPIEQ